MQISNLEIKEHDNLVRLSANVAWENCNEPNREIYIETDKAHGDDLSISLHAFLVGCLIPALHLGEKRIAIEGEIDPYLKEGLDTVMGIMKFWSDGRLQPLAIEAGILSHSEFDQKDRHAGLFLSGGMDSLAALRLDKLHYPETHPGSVKECLLVHGFDIGGVVERGMKFHVFERAKKAMAAVAEDAGVGLIPVYTNIRHLCDDRVLWLDKFFGAVLAAVGHAFASRFNLLHIASSFDLPNLVPCGSHPLLDPMYSSIDLHIRHRDVELSRMDKIRIVSGWDAAFQNFRVCLANVKDRLNCGKCEKCVRTMLGLEALGVLDKTRAFVEDNVTPDMLSPFKITIRHRPPFYEELIEPLRKRGRDDLVAVIEKKLREGT
jgi:hypothetical protein